MLLGGRQDEYHVCRRFLKSLQEGVECRCRQHVHLVDDKHLILTHLRRYSCLFHQSLDVLHRVVAGSVELKDVIRALFVERLAAFAFVAGLTFSSRVLAVDGLGALCPTTESKVIGRYFLAETIYSSIIFLK